MNPSCFICKYPSNFLLKKDGFDIYECPKCKLSFVYPQPIAEVLKKIYSYESGYQSSKKTDLSKIKESKRFSKIFDYIILEKAKGKILDVGCSNGQFLYWARERGFQCFGLEINKRTADIASQNGFDVFNGSIFDAHYEKEFFDIIALGDVLEHVSDPRVFVEKCTGLLKEDGILVIATPNMDSFWCKSTLLFYRLFKIPWSSCTPPHHLFQFSYGNLNKFMCDFNLNCKKAVFSSSPSLFYELTSLHLRTRYKEKRTITSFLYMIFSYGIYTILYLLDFFIKPFKRKDSSMVVCYSKTK